MFVTYILENIAMFILMMLLMKVFIRLLSIPMRYMFPFLLLMCIVGTYTANNRLFDAWVLFVIGIAVLMVAIPSVKKAKDTRKNKSEEH